MRKPTAIAACLLGIIGFCLFTQAGDLEPPGTPDSTMVTLEEISGQVKSLPPDTCFDNTGNRFVDCGNGTVKDTETGLFWLKAADCIGDLDWAAANIAAAQLADGQCGLTDGSTLGDWRLPTLACPSPSPGSCNLADGTGEFASIIAPSCPAPHILNTAGTGCWSEGDPFSGVQTLWYWSSSTYASSPGTAWNAFLNNGAVVANTKTVDINHGAWPVRGGQ